MFCGLDSGFLLPKGCIAVSFESKRRKSLPVMCAIPVPLLALASNALVSENVSTTSGVLGIELTFLDKAKTLIAYASSLN